MTAGLSPPILHRLDSALGPSVKAQGRQSLCPRKRSCPSRAAPGAADQNHLALVQGIFASSRDLLTSSPRAGVMQIAGFGFNLFADEYPSPEAGGGGVNSLFLIIPGIFYKAL